MTTPTEKWRSIPPEQFLKERFHINTGFHPGQLEIIEQLVQGQRVLAIQRTGWGKSLCYQMTSLYYPHLTIVFSPLKALLRDQCRHCNSAYSISAAIISSDFTGEENKVTLEQAVAEQFKILFIAPERLSNALWQSYVAQLRISMIVIDEAHCISTWGHDFRPHYRRIVRLLNALPHHLPVLAMTATANKRVEADILQQIGTTAQVIRGTLQRPNLHLQVVRLNGEQEKLGYLAEVLLPRTDTGIIYTATQSSAVIVATFLNRLGMNAEYYHADRGDQLRQDIEQRFMANHYYQSVLSCIRLSTIGLQKRDLLLELDITEDELRNILADLEEQHFIAYHPQERTYTGTGRSGQIDFTKFAIVRSQRQQELEHMQRYVESKACYMSYLTTYLGEQDEYTCDHCGYCQPESFPFVFPSERIQTAVIYFLNEDFMPSIERYSAEHLTAHEYGWSLSYHSKSAIGKQVRASKYENAGPFALGLVTRAVEVIRARYPIAAIQGIVSVPPTKNGLLVEMFAHQIANALGIVFLPVLAKVRLTKEQKELRNRLQKTVNIKDAFSVRYPEQVVGKALLLIDDIYDSGATIREVGHVLMQAGAKAVYPLTITRTVHSDDQ